MIPPNQILSVFKHKSLDLSQVMAGNSPISRQRNRIKPVLAFALGRADMNVSGLGRLVRIEMEAKLADSQDRWHTSILPHNGSQSIPARDLMVEPGIVRRLM
jgi:hypothetical protein